MGKSRIYYIDSFRIIIKSENRTVMLLHTRKTKVYVVWYGTVCFSRHTKWGIRGIFKAICDNCDYNCMNNIQK